MKSLALAAALLVSAPALACPNMDHDDAPTTPRTADKAPAKKPDAPKAKDTAKPADKAPADSAKAKDSAKPADAKKPADKVSMK